MKRSFETLIAHETPEDPGACCGCFNLVIDEDDPARPAFVCNECGAREELVEVAGRDAVLPRS